MNDVAKPSTTADRLHAQTVITERLENYSLLVSAGGLRAADVSRTLDWLSSDEFAATCRDAGADPAIVAEKFYNLTVLPGIFDRSRSTE